MASLRVQRGSWDTTLAKREAKTFLERMMHLWEVESPFAMLLYCIINYLLDHALTVPLFTGVCW